MFRKSLQSIVTGLQFGLLAGIWVLATELVYSWALLPYPVHFDGRLVFLYALVFSVVGIGGGIVGAGFRRFGAALPAAAVGAGLTLLILALRVHDLSDTGFSVSIDGGLALFTLLIVATAIWIGSRMRETALRAVLPSALLAGYMPALVLAAKLLVGAAPIPLSHPIPVALAMVFFFPLLLIQAYRLIVRFLSTSRLVPALWVLPVVVTVACSLGTRTDLTLQPIPASAAAAPSQPPIVWITIDTLRADHMSVYGYETKTTPNLEEFARGATMYSRCLAQGPCTWQSVPSLLSGLTPYRHGGVTETRRLRDDLELLPEILQRRGYQTIGQSANPWVSDRYGMAQGFEDFRVYNTDSELVLYDIMKLATRVAPYQIFQMRDYLPSYAEVSVTTLVADTAEILRTRDLARPLFLYMQPIDPHGPYQPPHRYLEPEASELGASDYVSYWTLKNGVTVSPSQRDGIVALYDGEITYTDAELGRLFGMLRDAGLYEQAMIIVTSDHGEQFHDHGLWRHSNSMYQQLLHVPLIIKYPGQQTGSVVGAPVATIDIMPTILRNLGRDCQACEGRALQDVGSPSFDAPLFAYLMGRTDVRPVLRAIVAGGWKLIRVQKPGVTTEELFHLDSDPAEEHDQRTARPEIAAHLGQLIDSYELKAGPTPLPDTITLGQAETERLKALGYVQ